MDLKASLIKNSKDIDEFLDINLPKPKGIHKKLLQAMRYSTIGAGKKIRGFLVFETGKMIFKTYSIVLGGFRGTPLKIGVFRSCAENLVQFR